MADKYTNSEFPSMFAGVGIERTCVSTSSESDEFIKICYKYLIQIIIHFFCRFIDFI